MNGRYEFLEVALTDSGPLLQKSCCDVSDDCGTLVLRPLKAGICRSDIREVQQSRPVRRDFGHEIAALVEWASVDSPHVIGDFVCLDPHIPVKRTSGFAELIIAHSTPHMLAQAFPRLDLAVPVSQGIWCEPLACAFHCVQTLLKCTGRDDLATENIAIIGAGNSGCLIALVSQYFDATVTVINRTMDRLQFIEQRGVFDRERLCHTHAAPNSTYSAVIIATSVIDTDTLRLADSLVLNGGLVVLFGGTRDGLIPVDPWGAVDRIRRDELLLTVTWPTKRCRLAGTYGANAADFRGAIDLLSYHPDRFPLERLVAQHISLEELPKTLLAIAACRTRMLGKIVVDITS